MESLTITKCEEHEVSVVGALYDKCVAYLDAHINYPKWKYLSYPTTSSAEAAFKEGSLFVAKKNGQVVGAFVLNENPQGAYHKAHWAKPLQEGEYLVIHAVTVDPSQYRKGFASQMIRFCIAFAEKHHYKGLRVDIVPENLPSIHLFEKEGFSFVEELDLERGFPDIPTFCLMEMCF